MVKSSPDVERLKIEAYARMTAAEKLSLMQDMINFVSELSSSIFARSIPMRMNTSLR